jgi:tellurite resistance protein
LHRGVAQIGHCSNSGVSSGHWPAQVCGYLLPGRGTVNILRRNITPERHPMSDPVPHPLSPEDCLVAVMIAISASDEDIRTAELVKIESQINNLPVFANYDLDRLRALFGLIRANLPEHLFETAYALACDVAAADGTLNDRELRLLEEMRYELNIDRLHAAAIERGARARHMTV